MNEIPHREPWEADFPKVFLHCSLEERNGNPDYLAAKAGDWTAAIQLTRQLLNDATLQSLADRFSHLNPILAAVSAIEPLGFNAIPDGMASEIANRLGWRFDQGEVCQNNRVGHTRADGWHRLATQAEFSGQVLEEANYILVDDHIGFGGTLANMRGYILARGAKVVAMTTLTETTNAATIALRASTLEQLKSKHGSELDDVWREEFGYGLECCTEVEAGYLLRMRSIEFIRTSLAKAAKKAGLHSR